MEANVLTDCGWHALRNGVTASLAPTNFSKTAQRAVSVTTNYDQ